MPHKKQFIYKDTLVDFWLVCFSFSYLMQLPGKWIVFKNHIIIYRCIWGFKWISVTCFSFSRLNPVYRALRKFSAFGEKVQAACPGDGPQTEVPYAYIPVCPTGVLNCQEQLSTPGSPDWLATTESYTPPFPPKELPAIVEPSSLEALTFLEIETLSMAPVLLVASVSALLPSINPWPSHTSPWTQDLWCILLVNLCRCARGYGRLDMSICRWPRR